VVILRACVARPKRFAHRRPTFQHAQVVASKMSDAPATKKQPRRPTTLHQKYACTGQCNCLAGRSSDNRPQEPILRGTQPRRARSNALPEADPPHPPPRALTFASLSHRHPTCPSACRLPDMFSCILQSRQMKCSLIRPTRRARRLTHTRPVCLRAQAMLTNTRQQGATRRAHVAHT